MRNIRHIFIGAVLAGLTAQAAIAGSLTRAEQTVCQSLRMCMDIVARHNATEFDYVVLTEEFRRFGPKGRAALFKLLQSDDGRADVAVMLVQLGPVSAEERAVRDAAWGGPETEKWLPLADATSSWAALLDHPDRALRELANTEIFLADQQGKAIVIEDYAPLLTFLATRPSEHLAQHLDGIDVDLHRKALTGLLLSGERHTAGAAYAALYRDNPATAFEALLSAMKNVRTVEQATAIGGLLAGRDTGRPDGFYRKFVAELSRDTAYPPTARAAALDGFLKIIEANPDKTFQAKMSLAQQEGLSFLLSAPNMSAPDYAAGLAKISEADLPALWSHLDAHIIPDATRALSDFEGTAFERDILNAALRSRDGDVRAAAQTRAKALNLPIPPAALQACSFKAFDIVGLRDQMPFFEDGFITGSWPQFMAPTSRRFLSAAHPTKTGWLAGYDVGEFGGGLVHYDNRTGEGTNIRLNGSYADIDEGSAENVVAILPDRILPLGQTAQAFWVITELNHFGFYGPTVFRLTETETGFSVKRLAHKISSTDRVAVSPQGDLLMSSKDGATVRLSSEGALYQGCPTLSGGLVPAPN